MKSTSLAAEMTLMVTRKAYGGGSRIGIGNPNLFTAPKLMLLWLPLKVAGDRRLGGLPH
ncbi:unnamed protein product [Brassica rapa subsp. narinosa]